MAELQKQIMAPKRIYMLLLINVNRGRVFHYPFSLFQIIFLQRLFASTFQKFYIYIVEIYAVFHVLQKGFLVYLVSK